MAYFRFCVVLVSQHDLNVFACNCGKLCNVSGVAIVVIALLLLFVIATHIGA
jgi:hypothetical protein